MTVSFEIMNDTRNPALPEGRYLVRNVASGLLLEVYGGAKGSGANVQQGKESGSTAQQWHISPCTAAAGSTTW